MRLYVAISDRANDFSSADVWVNSSGWEWVVFWIPNWTTFTSIKCIQLKQIKTVKRVRIINPFSEGLIYVTLVKDILTALQLCHAHSKPKFIWDSFIVYISRMREKAVSCSLAYIFINKSFNKTILIVHN